MNRNFAHGYNHVAFQYAGLVLNDETRAMFRRTRTAYQAKKSRVRSQAKADAIGGAIRALTEMIVLADGERIDLDEK